jgi:two-component system LytT family response regulator
MTATTLANVAETEIFFSSLAAENGVIKLRTLIVDDQMIGRELLRRMLVNEPGIEIVGMAGNGPEAVEIIHQLAPDLVLLDVQMPDMDGFAVLGQIKPERMPMIIFVTAHDDFALKAFDVHAVDYLIKPCRQERLQMALRRARGNIQRHQTGEINQRLAALVQDFKGAPRKVERLAVKTGGRILFLRLVDIDWVEAADNYVKIHIGKEEHLLRETLAALESKLPDDRFLRISRSAIVNVEHIREMHPMFHGEYIVVLRNGAQVTLTRGYREKLERLGVG